MNVPATIALVRGYLAQPRGDARGIFANEGPPMAALLARLIAAQRSGSGFGAVAEVPLGCLARLQRALAAQGVAPDAGRASVTAAPGLVDPLTSRELEVLETLAAGSSNQVTASQLVVTLDNVKKHVSHVLGKLGAANRTEAVARARARELSLIPLGWGYGRAALRGPIGGGLRARCLAGHQAAYAQAPP